MWNPIISCQPENQFKLGAYKGDKCIYEEEEEKEEKDEEEDETEDETEEDTFIPGLDPCRSYNVASECWRQPNCKYNPRKGCTDLDVGDDRDELKRLWDQRVQEEEEEEEEEEEQQQEEADLQTLDFLGS
jgi:hypothetical protein